MADIVINEISQNYSYVIGDSSYCCVALPITACWGPAYTGYDSAAEEEGETKEDLLEDVVWSRFKANSQGLESFVSTYRGAASNYRLSQDYSYQMAVSLLTAGYDVLVCRLSPGSEATGMLRRNYVGKIPDDWFSRIDANNNLELQMYEDETAIDGNTPLSTIPLVVNSEHKLSVVSTNPNFAGLSISNPVDSVALTDETGIYAIEGSTEDSISKVVFHVKGVDGETTGKDVWASNGINAGDAITFTGDKAIQTIDGSSGSLTVTAKYPGTFGNRLQCTLRRMTTVGITYWNFVVYVVDNSGVRVAVENLNFVFDIEDSTDNILFIEEVKSQFVDLVASGLTEKSRFTGSSQYQEDKMTIVLTSGQDKSADKSEEEYLKKAVEHAEIRYNTQVVPVTRDGDQTFDSTSDNKIKQGDTFTITLPEGVDNISKVTSCKYKSNSSADEQLLTISTDYTVDFEHNRINLSNTSAIIPDAQSAVATSSLIVEFTYPDGKAIKSNVPYVQALCDKYNHYTSVDKTTAATWEYLEWLFTNSMDIYDLLHDRLAYNPNRVISPGWDDQDFLRITGESSYNLNITTPSPLHIKLMETAYYSRCATAYIDLPRSLAKKHVSNDSQQTNERGYAQLLARQDIADSDGLFTTHAALFGPWGTFMYVGTNKQQTASPSFLALLIQRSMILNQALQYEWVQPSSRKNRVNIGKMDYTVSKKYLDIWQPDPDTTGGVGVNAIANIPDLGLSIWGDSTLYENPPATYQALRNLSTRLLVNAIKNVVYKVGISITFQYTNQTAFSSFYVGVTPILDSMVNAGAIGDYKVVIGNDFDAVGMVKANSCVGKIYITPNGTIQHITVDLIALPPQTDLSNYS